MLVLIEWLGGLNIRSLLAFRALRDFERNFLTFFESLEAIHLNCGEVGEQIFTAVIRSDKSEAFGIVEPLDGTCCHKSVFQIITNHTSRKSKKPRDTLPLLKPAHFLLAIAQCVTVNEYHCSRKKNKSQGGLDAIFDILQLVRDKKFLEFGRLNIICVLEKKRVRSI